MRAIKFSEKLGDIERLESSGPCAALRCKLEPLGVNDCFQIKKRPVKQLVDYNEVKLLGLGDLNRGIFHAQFDSFSGIFASAF
jgi:hypothetical protein